MQPGQILVASQSGVYVIKMLGDVRLTLCVSFDNFIDDMFADAEFSSVMFDLSGAEAIDSTTLGLMAKISILGAERRDTVPWVYSTNPSVNRLLDSMGFADIFHIINDMTQSELVLPAGLAESLADSNLAEGDVKKKVIEAHRILMALNENNRNEFTDLVHILESDC